MQKTQREKAINTENSFDGSIIKVMRKQRGISQKGLARQAGISNSYLSGVETGRTSPSLKTLMRIAEQLDTDINTFIQINNKN